MQTAMLRLDALLRRRHRVVLLVWAALFVAAVPFALKQGDELTGGGFSVPGSESQRVLDAVDERFDPRAGEASLGVVLVPHEGATGRDRALALREVDAAAREVDHAAFDLATARQVVRDTPLERPVVLPLRVDVDDMEAADVATDLRKALGLKEADGAAAVGVHLVGQQALWAGLQDLSKEDLEKAEATGFPIVLLILLAVFGSLAAAFLPLALGVVSVLLTGALIYGLSLVMEMSVFVTNMASMIGIGVAVDYSLFVLARYREEVRAGKDPDEARAVALATSGVAVLFSGLTVIVSLAGLYVIPTTAIRSMALGAILVVAVSMLAAATLLPVLIRVLGKRAYARGRVYSVLQLLVRAARTRRRRRGLTDPAAAPPVSFWTRWTTAVMRRPVLSLVGAAAVLVVLAIPALSMQTANGALRQFPEGNETRVGIEAAASVAGPGASSPVRVVAPAAQAAGVRRALQADPEVVRVAAPVRSQDGAQVLLVAEPRRDGEAPETRALVQRLRDTLPTGVLVGGNPAAQQDIEDTISGSMWKIVLFVLGLSYLVLMVLLRSVVLPLKAVVMNLLSVGAAYGVLVVVFQWGWFDGITGFDSPGHIDTITPPLVLAVVFGLSMDYEVFLLSRIKERYAATGDTRLAVAQGLASSARTITSAALIMVAVFAVFVGTGVPSIKELGLGNAVAIAVDATLVRLVLVPAAMELLGKWNWYLPRRLGRVLPEAHMEELKPAPA